MKKEFFRIVLFVLLMAVVIHVVTPEADTSESVEWVEVVVQEDDTVWNLVRKENPDADVRPLIALVDQTVIHVGEVIAIPVRR